MRFRCAAILATILAFGAGSISLTQAGVADLYAAAGVQRISEKTPVPTFSLKTLNGPSLDVTSLRGKVVVVNFWATWCVPCKEEMPALQRLQQAFPAGDVVVVAITTDQQREAITGFAKTLGLSFPILLDETKDVSAAFGVRGLPTTLIIGRDGKLAGRAVGPREWDSPETGALLRSVLQ